MIQHLSVDTASQSRGAIEIARKIKGLVAVGLLERPEANQ